MGKVLRTSTLPLPFMEVMIAAYCIIEVVLGVVCLILPVYALAKFFFVWPSLEVMRVTVMLPAMYMMLIGGFLLMVLLLAACGSTLAQKRSFVFYCVLVALLPALLLLVAAALLFAARFQVGEEGWAQDRLRVMIRDHYSQEGSKEWTRSWDNFQEHYQCCAVLDESWGVYQSSKWSGDVNQNTVEGFSKIFVPETCCVRNQYGEVNAKTQCQTSNEGPPRIQGGKPNPALLNKGCYSPLIAFLNYWSLVLGIFSVAVALLTFAGCIFIMIRSKRSKEKLPEAVVNPGRVFAITDFNS